MSGIETLYTVLLILALVLNGIAITGATPLRELFTPLRETRIVAKIVGIDTILVPVVVVGLALALGLDDVTRAGLIIVAATSAGPIGIALARVGRGDIALSVTLVTGIGLLNLATVPIVTGLLLPESIAFPIGPVLANLLSLLVAPLLAGRVVAAVMTRARASHEFRVRLLGSIGGAASASLVGAVSVALFLEPELTAEVVRGPVTPIAIITMLVVTIAARSITPDAARRRTISLVVNARAVGLALALTALHLGDVPGLRATVLAYGGLTQLVPILVVLIARRRTRSLSG